jgi:peptidoglycan/LPS O-acetylase OafA/YrhL
MEDTPEQLVRWPQLREALQACRETTLPAYLKADEPALRHQRWHRWLTKAAAVLGTVAVLAAILQWSELVNPSWPMGVEIGAALFAAISVLFGVLSLCRRSPSQ